MHTPIVRSARLGDLARILELYRHLNTDEPSPEPAKAEAAWRALIGSSLSTVFVVDESESLLASRTLTIVPNLTRGARPHGVIKNVVTGAEHRRLGLGRAVRAAALDTAWLAACYKVMLASGRDEDTPRFYETVGFKRGGKTLFEIRRT